MAIQHDPLSNELQARIDAGVPVLIDFHAAWCGPCRMIAPKYQELSDAKPGIEFYKVDVDKRPELAAKMGVTAMPTFIGFKGGKQVKMVMGADVRQLESLVAMLQD